jgi:DNA-binding protein YbaB
MEQMGREIERMDQEMSDIQEEIEQLERNRFNLVAVPLTSIKTHKF